MSLAAALPSKDRWSKLEELFSRLLYGLAVLLALALPFEIIQPALSLPWFRFTNLEALVWFTAFVWIGHLVVITFRGRLGQHITAAWRSHASLILPAVLFLLLATMSALTAPAFRVEALKFVTRFASGLYAFSLIVYVAQSRPRLVGLLWAVIAGGGLSALVGIAEGAGWSLLKPFLSLFSQMPTHVGGDLRINATFVYTTVASMFFEMIIPLALAMSASATNKAARLAAVAVAGLCTAAVVLTLTRSGIITVVVILVVMFLLAATRTRWRTLLIPTAAATLVLVVVTATLAVTTSSFATRLTTENDLNWFGATYNAPPSVTARAGDVITLMVEVRNTGVTKWVVTGDYPFALGYRWMSSDGQTSVSLSHAEVALPHEVAPGESDRLAVSMKVPVPAGRYQISWGMLQHNILWFRSRGVAEAQTVVDVTPGMPVPDLNAVPIIGPTRDDLLAPPPPVSRTQLWRIALRMVTERPFLGVGPDNFRHLYGGYLHLARTDDRTHANNFYLEFLADLGVTGAVSFAGLFIVIAWRLLRLMRTPPAASEALWAAGLGGSLLAFLIHGFSDYFLEFVSLYLLFWIVLGLGVALARLRKAENRLLDPVPDDASA